MHVKIVWPRNVVASASPITIKQESVYYNLVQDVAADQKYKTLVQVCRVGYVMIGVSKTGWKEIANHRMMTNAAYA